MSDIIKPDKLVVSFENQHCMKPLPQHSVVDCLKKQCDDCSEIAAAVREDLGLDA